MEIATSRPIKPHISPSKPNKIISASKPPKFTHHQSNPAKWHISSSEPTKITHLHIETNQNRTYLYRTQSKSCICTSESIKITHLRIESEQNNTFPHRNGPKSRISISRPSKIIISASKTINQLSPPTRLAIHGHILCLTAVAGPIQLEFGIANKETCGRG